MSKVKLKDISKNKLENQVENKSKKSIKKEVISTKKKELEDDDDEPGLKEYLIVIIGVILVIGGLYFLFEIFYSIPESEEDPNLSYKEAGINETGFVYNYVPFEGRTVNINFVYNLESLEEFDFNQDLSKSWIYSYENISIITPPPINETSENVLLLKSSGKFASFLKNALFIRFTSDNFKSIGEGLNCENATRNHGIIIFNYTSSKKGVYVNEANFNCMEIHAQNNATNFVQAVDKIMYDIILLDN